MNFPTKKKDTQELRVARESLDAVEARFASANLTLGQREMIAVRLREAIPEIVAAGEPDELIDRYRAVEERLQALDDAQFGALRERLYAGTYRPDDLRAQLAQLPSYELDAWTRRLFELHREPPTTVALGPEGVGYITTHVVQVLEMASELTPADVFYDLGSGLGFVPILISWLTGARAIGIEIEPAFVARAREQATKLGLGEKVSFLEKDLREQDYPDATAVFMFYPVRGASLEAVIAKVEARGRAHPLKVYSLGLSGQPLVDQPWIEVRGQSPSGLLALQSKVDAATKKTKPAAKKKK